MGGRARGGGLGRGCKGERGLWRRGPLGEGSWGWDLREDWRLGLKNLEKGAWGI